MTGAAVNVDSHTVPRGRGEPHLRVFRSTADNQSDIGCPGMQQDILMLWLTPQISGVQNTNHPKIVVHWFMYPLPCTAGVAVHTSAAVVSLVCCKSC